MNQATEQQIEQQIQDKGLTAPRLTPKDIDAKIFGAQFWVPKGTTLTVCAMQLVNGTMVVGTSACVSPENFNAEIGKDIAYNNAREKIWELEGYLLKESLGHRPVGDRMIRPDLQEAHIQD